MIQDNNEIKIDTDNDFFKKYVRLLKNEKKYNNTYLSIERYETCKPYHRSVNKNSILSYIWIPEVFIDEKAPLIEYNELFKSFLLNTYELFTPHIIQYIKTHQDEYYFEKINDHDDEYLIKLFNEIIEKRLTSFNAVHNVSARLTYFRAIYQALIYVEQKELYNISIKKLENLLNSIEL